MTITQNLWPKWLLALFACALLGNVALSIHLSSRLARLEQRYGVDKQGITIDSEGTGAGRHNGDDIAQATSRAGISAKQASGGGLQDTAALVAQFKQQQMPEPAILATDLSRKMGAEPSLPQVEQQQKKWLLDSLGQMIADTPKANAVGASCRGRRCLVSASFASARDAEVWANQYLLAAGGQLLPRSQTVILPPTADGQPVDLQLYLF